ncbi:MotA/TolQ/ExbB proton channel family protein [Pseudobdellovibrio exovorus]|uniref:Adventurous gliding motility protein X n=1 Tax=Pseudobdellovibrio exovorus JSS TaxID=1184267 RepID=M4VAY3_9BACT|nr:MotA/TolQ/ExbB proton channel family protein [Pseudobdellovibrio exovorus]AGH96537.1 adventurous gliding motility protein X [Pseudobdellovibrio exovorus JSS]
MKNILNNNTSIVFLSLLILAQKGFAASPPTSTNVGTEMNALNSLLQASFVVQLTILILISLSILSWAIGWSKYQQFKKIKAANAEFDNLFWATSSFDSLFEKVDNFSESPHARVFKAAYLEMKKIAESPLMNKSHGDNPQLTGLDNLERSLRKASENEIANMEGRLTILASTGSTGPFIGLFGTVWGIMGSFHQIGVTGSASLAAVAPGISEALIATAIGLAAAIPAVMIYNNCISVIRKEEVSLNNFSTDFLNIVKRNFFKG